MTDDNRDDATPDNDSYPAEGGAEGTTRADERAGAPGDADASGEQPYGAPEPAEGGGRRRPPVAVIAASLLLLVAIGVGLAFAIPSGGAPAAQQPVPTAPASTAPGADPAPVPTALPLPAATGEYSSTEVIAEVGDGAIIRGDFVRSYQPGQDPQELLNQLIQVELVLQEAASEGVTADPEAVEEQITQIKATQAGGDDAQFTAFLDEVQVGSEANLRRLLERDSVLEQMILRHTTAEQARARHILIATQATTDTAELEELKSEAEGLLADLEGGADFAALAAERSDDPGSKEAGGDLGWAPRGLFVGPFDDAVFSMEAGERRLVQTDFGWHIIELLDEPEVRPFEDAALIQTPPGQQAFAETFIPWVEELVAQAEAADTITIVVPPEELVGQPAGS